MTIVGNSGSVLPDFREMRRKPVRNLFLKEQRHSTFIPSWPFPAGDWWSGLLPLSLCSLALVLAASKKAPGQKAEDAGCTLE